MFPHRYDENSQCGFISGRLHFAVHVRMGDRRGLNDESVSYFQLVEQIMSNISEAVTEKGLNPPLFHVFSETAAACPSEETGLFEEFPSWPVTRDQV